MKRIPMLAVAILLLSANLISQQPVEKSKGQPDTAPFNVSINFAAIDAQGVLVDAIAKDEIKLFEDGVEQTVLGVTRNTSSLNLALVVDNTGSVRDQIDTIEQIGNFLLKGLDKQDEAKIIRFVGRDKIQSLNEWTSDKKVLSDGLENLFAEGGQSAVVDALYDALEAIENRKSTHPDRRYAIVLISDCEDRNSYYNQKQLIEKVTASGVPIFVIAMNQYQGSSLRKRTDKFAASLAMRSGGSLYTLGKRSRLEDFSPLINELRAPFKVFYRPVDQSQNGKERKIAIELKPDKNGIARTAVLRGHIVVPEIP